MAVAWFVAEGRMLCALGAGLLFAACRDPGAAEPSSNTTSTSSTGVVDETTAPSTEATSSSSPDQDTSTAADNSSGASESTGVRTCQLPDAAPPWLDAHLREVVGTLSGELEISAGVSLSDRSNATRRAQAAVWLLSRFSEDGVEAESHDYGTGANVVARVPATGPSLGTYVIGAHYDSVYGSPGADDNASGTAVVTALARWLIDVPCRSHDVLLVALDQEEIGLVGSEAFAAKLIADEEPVIAVHTIDMIGWDADGDRAIELARPDTGLFEFYDDVAGDVPGLGPLYSTTSGSSDHVAFRGAGFAAVGILEAWDHHDTSPYYHKPSDRYDTIDFDYVATAATLINRAFGRAVGEP